MGSLTDKHKTITGYDFRVDEPLGPLRAIAKKCQECNCGSYPEIKLCEIYDCPLWPLRPGYRKKHTKVMTEEQRQIASDRMKKMMEKKRDKINMHR